MISLYISSTIVKIIVNKYNEWIKCLEKDVENFNGVLKKAALKNIAECKICSKRIDKGIEILKNNNNKKLIKNNSN